ncbi:MAG: hypothetical protein KAT62_05590 [Desulfuromonadales bacterium]|nr:hypothetical protein [Desulfuromonadales bacterium]
MRIDINIPPGKAQTFLLYFTAEAKKHSKGPFPYGDSQAGYQEDGSYVAHLTGYLAEGEKTSLVNWTIPQAVDGSIPFIEFEPGQGDLAVRAQGFVGSVLSAAFSERKEVFFERDYFTHVGAMLDGEYWLHGFRFAPALREEEDPGPYLMDAERVICVDQELEAIDAEHARLLASCRADLMVTRLSLLTQIAFNRPSGNEQVWVFVKDEKNGLQSKRLHRGFRVESRNAMPKKRELCKLGKYGPSLENYEKCFGDLVRIPKETRRILRGLETSYGKQRAFDSCAKLYQLALLVRKYSISAEFAYKVAAVDALAQGTSYKHFSQFMRAQLHGEDGLESFLDVLHGNIRSAHFHGGELPLDLPVPSVGNLLDRGRHHNFNVQLHADRLLWKAISRWVLTEVAEPEA